MVTTLPPMEQDKSDFALTQAGLWSRGFYHEYKNLQTYWRLVESTDKCVTEVIKKKNTLC